MGLNSCVQGKARFQADQRWKLCQRFPRVLRGAIVFFIFILNTLGIQREPGLGGFNDL